MTTLKNMQKSEISVQHMFLFKAQVTRISVNSVNLLLPKMCSIVILILTIGQVELQLYSAKEA